MAISFEDDVRDSPVITCETQFSSLEHYASIGGGWDLDYVQLERGPLDARTVMYNGHRLFIKFVTYNRRFHQRGTSPPGFFSFGLTDDPYCHDAYGEPLQRHSMVRFNQHSGLDVMASAGFAGFPVSIREHFLFAVAEQMQLTLSPQHLARGPLVYPNAPGIVDSLLCDLRRLICLIRSSAEVLRSSQWIDDFEFSFTARLLAIITMPNIEWGRHGGDAVSYRRVNRALDYIRDSSYYPVTISKLCEVANTSWRTLERDFRKRFDVTPKQYLKNHALRQVRRELLNSDSRARINAIAGKWGFFHAGQFASDYRQCFGEMPRQTVRSVRQGTRRS